jgi:hypothetical protein
MTGSEPSTDPRHAVFEYIEAQIYPILNKEAVLGQVSIHLFPPSLSTGQTGDVCVLQDISQIVDSLMYGELSWETLDRGLGVVAEQVR